MKRDKKHSQSKLIVSVQDKNTPIIIVDLDKTLVEDGFLKVVLDSAKPLPYSAVAMNKIAKKYSIVYLTHRFSGMTTVSKQWLSENGFPVGPLLTNKSGELSSGDYKYGRLAHLKQKFKNIEIGVGDKESDIESCRSNGIKVYWILKYEDESRSLRKLSKKAAKFADDENVQVVVNWREIEEGILYGKDFSAAKRAQEFRNLATRHKKSKEETN
jgi:phosphatidate phosphatase PAH1